MLWLQLDKIVDRMLKLNQFIDYYGNQLWHEWMLWDAWSMNLDVIPFYRETYRFRIGNMEVCGWVSGKRFAGDL